MEAVLKRDKLINKDFSFFSEKVRRAISDYKMIEEGDRVLVAVSGGKDSLSMMHFLDYHHKNKVFDFQMLACHVDLGYGCANKKLLEEHFKSFDIKYIFTKKDILQGKSREDINCFWCSWNRRKVLFELAKKHNCNKVSLGHHLDDIVHTTMMNLFFYGEIATSSPYLELFEGVITLIRPLCYIKEEETEIFSEALNLPLPCCACPRKPTSKRTLIKNTFHSLFKAYPPVKENIFYALRQLKEATS